MHNLESYAYYQRFDAMEQEAGAIAPSFAAPNGLNLWPVLKRRFFADHHVLSPHAPVYGDGLERRDAAKPVYTADPALLAALGRLPKGQGVVFTDKDFHTRHLDGKLYDPYLDPVLEVIESVGLLPIKLQLYKGEMEACFHPPVEIFHRTRNMSVPGSKTPAVVGFEDYLDLCRRTDVPATPLWLIHGDLEIILSYADLFAPILEILRPRFVIFQEYYNYTAMGLGLACRRLGVPSVEYQHGIQSRHPMYTFRHLPKWGLEVVPKWFFTWGEYPAKQLGEMFSGQKFHRAAAAGKPEFRLYADGRMADAPQLLEALRERIAGRKAILVPFVLGVGPEDVQALRQAILESPPDWIWLLRRHPLAVFASEDLELGTELANIESDLCSTISLPGVLALTDHVVAGYSTICLDAYYGFGIPVTMLADAGRYNYAEFIAAGVLSQASTKDEILEAIRQGRKNPYPGAIPDSYISHEPTLLQARLRLLVGAYPR